VPADSSLQEAIAAFQQGALDRARVLAERQVEVAPTPDAFHLVGLIECRSGRLDRGIDWLRRALDESPDNLSFRVMLARALVDSGRPAEALEVAVPVEGASPAELALSHVRAEAADAAQSWDASAQAWGRLCAARPDDWLGWSNYANALGELGHWADAATAYRRAVDLNPGELPLRRALAAALGRCGRYWESADELARWVEDSPDDIGVRVMFARLLSDLGRNEELEAQLDKAAQLAGLPAFNESSEVLTAIAGASTDRVDAAILNELALLLERTNRLEALAGLLDAAEAQGIERERLGYAAAAVALRLGKPTEARRLLLAESPDAEALRRHWLMARIEEALGNSDAAFAEAGAMNRSVIDYDRWRERGRAHLEFVRDLAATITPVWARHLKTAAPSDRRRTAFLVGFPRSGTTLLDTFLMGHPSAAVLEEVPLISAIERTLGKIAELPRRSADELGRARDAYLTEMAEHIASDFSGLGIDKMPLNMIAAPFLHCVFPAAPIIFAQRHPCDAVLSCFMQPFALNDSMACFLDLTTAAEYYDSAMRVWQRSTELLPLNTHALVYEELVADPEAALRPLIAFLGLEWQDDLLDHRATAEARSAIGTPSYHQVTQPLSRSPSGRWKRYEKQLEPVLPVLLPWAERLGYSS